MTPDVLTAAQVAERRKFAAVYDDNALSTPLAELCDSHEALRGQAPTCLTCKHAGRRFELEAEGGYQECFEPRLRAYASDGRPLRNRDGSPFGCTLHEPLPSPPGEPPR